MLALIQHLHVVEKPDVYKSAVTDVYIVFGESKTEDMSAQIAQQQMAAAQAAQQQQMLENLAQQGGGGDFAAQAAALAGQSGSSEKKKEEEEEDDGSPIDEEGVDAKDIELVMSQVS
jgi:nascent polypeptide-associated complex subunit alpha